jgi:hypothetical protein
MPVMRPEEIEANRLGVVAPHHVPDREGIPEDFDIFSDPRLTNPLWSQDRTNGRAVAASDWAISFSWWGKMRSSPPPWRSKLSPR